MALSVATGCAIQGTGVWCATARQKDRRAGHARTRSNTAAPLFVILLATVAATAAAEVRQLPKVHRQFSTRIETTAHQLNATNDYPPYKRYMTVHYDYDARRVRIDYDPVPHMPPKSFVRRFDLGFEWMVMEVREMKECQKSRMKEAMPMPRFPDRFIYLGQTRVRGRQCDHWREDVGEESYEYFASTEDHAPVRLTTEAVEATTPERITTPLMTYDFSRFEAGAPSDELFTMQSSTK